MTRLHVEVDGTAAEGDPIYWSRRGPHTVRAWVTDRHGEVLPLEPNQVQLSWLTGASERAEGPAEPGDEVLFELAKTRPFGVLRVQYKRHTCTIPAFGMATGATLTVLVGALLTLPVVLLTAMRVFVNVDSALESGLQFAKELLETIGVGAGFLVGFELSRQAVTRKSFAPLLKPLLSPLGWAALALSASIITVALTQFSRVHRNETGGEIAASDERIWKTGELWLLSSPDQYLKDPLCAFDSSTCTWTSTKPHFLFEWLGGTRVGCRRWWPEGSNLKERIGEGCNSAELYDAGLRVVFERQLEAGVRDQRKARASSDASAGKARPPLELTPTSFDWRGIALPHVRIRSAATTLDVMRPVHVTLSPGGRVSHEVILRRVEFSVDREYTALAPVEPGDLLRAEFRDHEGAPPFGDLLCRAAVGPPGKSPGSWDVQLVELSAPLVREAVVRVGPTQVASWRSAPGGARTAMAVCLPQPRGDLTVARETRLQLTFVEAWQPDTSWRFAVPAEIDAVELRLSTGEYLGAARRLAEGAAWSVSAHVFKERLRQPVREIIAVVDSRRAVAWRRAPGEASPHPEWFWLSESTPGACTADFGRGLQGFSCHEAEVSVPPPQPRLCYFKHGEKVRFCPGAKPFPPDNNDLRLLQGSSRCDELLRCPT